MNRTLHLAVLLSLALHGALLFSLSVERRPSLREPPMPRLEARLVETEPPAAQPVTVPPAPPPPAPQVERKAEPKRAQKKVVRPKPAPAPRVAEPRPAPEPQPPPAEAEPAPIAQPQPQPEPQVLETPAPRPSVVQAVPKPAPAPPAGPSAAQLEAATRDQYRLALINAARRHNRYPPLARENNWEGEVLVRMVIGADGAVSLSVQRSSRHEVLDRQALEMFRRAQAQVPLPPSLRGKALSFELKAIYSLKDQASG